MLLGRDIAEHRCASPTDESGTNGTGDMVVARRDVGHQWTEGIERSMVALLLFTLHVFPNLLKRYMSRPLDKYLHILVPCPLHQFTHSVEFRKLRPVIGIVDGARPQTIAEGDGDIVPSADVADVVEMGIEKTLLLMHGAPRRDDAASSADHAREPVERVVHVFQAYAAMDGEIVYALLTLLDERIAVDIPREVGNLLVHLFESLIERHSAHRHRTVAQDMLTRLMDMATRGEIHQRVTAPFTAPHCFLHLFLEVGRECRVADVGIDLY